MQREGWCVPSIEHAQLKTLTGRDRREMKLPRPVVTPKPARYDERLTTADFVFHLAHRNGMGHPVIGLLQGVLYAATTGRHTDFTAKLVEVRADGYARIIEDGIRRGPDSSPLRRIEPMTPGKVYRFTIDLGATGLVIAAGNRLRVEISSSNFPKYTRNPNTGEPPEAATVFETVTQSVYHSNEYPSHFLLPVVP